MRISGSNNFRTEDDAYWIIDQPRVTHTEDIPKSHTALGVVKQFLR
jgi:hypothetical protein